MHPLEIRQQALALFAAGHNDCEVSRRLNVPRRTVGDWRRPPYRRCFPVQTCPRCWRPAKLIRLAVSDYAELLGLYLGDGYISGGPRCYRLRVTLDCKHPGIIDPGIIAETAALLARCFPANKVDRVVSGTGTWVNVSVYSIHLPCVFPQHGPGRKHERELRLEAWQSLALESAPRRFIRGCIRTDGCAFINRTGPYEYLSYSFANHSGEIVDLFVSACDRVGVITRVTRRGPRWSVRINRCESVALMLREVGLKS